MGFRIAKIVLGLNLAFAVGACGSATPSQELVAARAAYEEASESQAKELVPDQLLEARQALDSAESEFDDDDNSPRARTLAYVAHRKALIAMAAAGVSAAKKLATAAESEYKDLLEVVAKRQKDKLGKTESSLEKTKAELERERKELEARQKELAEQQKQLTEEQQKRQGTESELAKERSELAKERAAREEAEKRLAAAMRSLEEIAKVQEDARGTIITLSGAVLFKTNEAKLLPIAEQQLRKVADALNAYDEGRKIVVAGHTDSKGSVSANHRLSQSRADSVRLFLVQNGVASNRISSVGRGEDEPIADNRTAEGRANNRRVEIIVEGK